MAKYFMHICNGSGFLEDREGVDLADDEEARTRAVAAARDVMASDIRDGRLDLSSFIEVENGNRELLFTITFADVVTLTHKH